MLLSIQNITYNRKCVTRQHQQNQIEVCSTKVLCPKNCFRENLKDTKVVCPIMSTYNICAFDTGTYYDLLTESRYFARTKTNQALQSNYWQQD